MPSIKQSVNHDAKSAFATYDGPPVPAGSGYRGVIKQVRVKESSSGNLYLNVTVEHQDTGDRSKYNGAAQFIRVMFGDHEETQARLSSFIKAATGKPGKGNTDVNIVDTDESARAGTGSIVKTIDKVNPVGKAVRFDVRMGNASGGYEARLEGDMIRPDKDGPAASTKPIVPSEEPDEEIEDEELEDDGDDLTREERAAELKKESLADLKAAAKEAEIDIKGLKKAEIVEAILDWEFDEDSEGEDEEVDEDEELEDEELEEDSEEEDEEDEEEEEDEVETLRSELADLDRTALKARIKSVDSEFRVLKSMTDDDLRNAIIEKSTEAPF